VKEKPQLGAVFHVLFVAPLVIAVATAAMAIKSDDYYGSIGWLLGLINLAGMLICAVVCSIIAGKRRTASFGLLTFLGIVALYLLVGFIWLGIMGGQIVFD
jgi:hypothetical protein